ncbi:MAG: hypothetical protein GY862_10200, partial [Gammaproteobacteria bacterium]|nr:hypothetical protein [Gammaproteobacteria bacterium]
MYLALLRDAAGLPGYPANEAGNYALPSRLPHIVSPAPNSRLSGDTETFSWTNSDAEATGWWIHIGTSAGAGDICNLPDLPQQVTEQTVSGLPADGSTIYVRLWYLTAEAWKYADFVYTAGGDGVPAADLKNSAGYTRAWAELDDSGKSIADIVFKTQG